MKSIVSLLALTASCATAVPATRNAFSQFTLTMSSNDSRLNNLALVDANNNEIDLAADFEPVTSPNENPTIFFLESGATARSSSSRLATNSTVDGALRFAYVGNSNYTGGVWFHNDGSDDGTVYYPKFTITSDGYLSPAGNLTWAFCWYPEPSSVVLGSVWLGKPPGCTVLHGLKAVASDQ